MNGIPSFLRFENGGAPKEATGLALDYFGRCPIIMTGIFMCPALLKLVMEAAGCTNETQCNATFLGMTPATLWTNIISVSGFLSAIFMPLFGTIVDHTAHRRLVGTYSAWLLVVVTAAQLIVNKHTWVFLAFCQVVAITTYNIHSVITYAYNAELSRDPDQQTFYNSQYAIIQSSAYIIFVSITLTIAAVFQLDTYWTATASEAIGLLFLGWSFGLCWPSLFDDMPASSILPEGTTLWNAGFHKLCRTLASMKENVPALRWAIVAVLFTESGLVSLLSISVTFFVDYMQMTSVEVGLVNLIILLSGVVGAKAAEFVSTKKNPLFSTMFAVFLLIVWTTAACLILLPSRKVWAYVFGAGWGALVVWIFATDLTLFVVLSPPHSRRELMGIYKFAQSGGSWVPPLVFSLLVSTGFSMTTGLASVNIFFVAGLICYSMIGNFDDGMDRATRSVLPRKEPTEDMLAVLTEDGSSLDGSALSVEEAKGSVMVPTPPVVSYGSIS